MELIDVVQQIVQRSVRDAALADLVVGTVSKSSPIEVTEQDVRDPIPAQALMLTAAVVEKKMPVLTHRHETGHRHDIHDSYSGGGICDEAGSCSEELGRVACYENGKALPVRDGYILLNRGLEVGDRVLMLRVLGGQSYIILSRVFEGGA